jgi:hypothetical protein
MQNYAAGVTIDVAGTLVKTDNITAGGQGTDDQASRGGFISPPGSTFYSTYTNNDGASVGLDISNLFAALPDLPT